MAICAPLGSRDGRDPLLVSNHPYYIHVSLLLRLGKAVRPCRTGIFHGSFVVEKNVLCYNQNMGKNRRSKEFKNNSQVIDMEEARARRQQKRRAEKEKKEEKELRAKQQNTRGKRAIRRSKTRRKIITGITIAIIVLLVFLLVFNIISLKKEQYDTKKEQQALKQQKAELQKELENAETPENIEAQARQQLRLIKPGERGQQPMMQDKNKAVSRIAAVAPLPKIREILVVEGRDDTAAIKKSVDAITIETHGYGITDKTWKLIEEAYNGPGIIVFTDPDHAGEQIRRRIMEKFPEARQAFLDRKAATKKGDIGIENADPESIREALRKAHGSFDAKPAAPVFLQKDLLDAGLIGQADSAARREKLGKILGIGYGNGKVMLQRLNSFGIERDAFEQAVQEL